MKGMTNDMNEIIVYHDPLEAWFWTHMEISIPIMVILAVEIITYCVINDLDGRW